MDGVEDAGGRVPEANLLVFALHPAP